MKEDDGSRLYDFVYRGQLTEEALDRAGRLRDEPTPSEYDEFFSLLSIDILDAQLVFSARDMSIVYTAVAAFENSVRELIKDTLIEAIGDNWWEQCVSDRMKKQAEALKKKDEEARWHSARGEHPLNYTMLPNLMNIIKNNYEHFEPFIHSIEWASGVFEIVHRSRNVIMHSGTLTKRDVARLGTFIRDWTVQVST